MLSNHVYDSSSLVSDSVACCCHMMTSSNGNIFRVTGPLCGETTGHRWTPPSQRPVARSFDVFFDLRLKKRLSKHSRRRWFEKPSSQLWYWKCNINTIFKPHVFRFLNYNHAFSFFTFYRKRFDTNEIHYKVFPDDYIYGVNRFWCLYIPIYTYCHDLLWKKLCSSKTQQS